MRTGKLNVFQRAMLQWNDLHPYHAVHVLHLRGKADLEQLHRVIHRCLTVHGLNGLMLDRRSGSFQYGEGRLSADLSLVQPGPDPIVSIHSEIERQLSRRFAIQSPFTPFRFFVVPNGDRFFLGLTYFHPVADAESVSLLLRELAVDYHTGKRPDPGRRLDCHPPRHDRLWFSRAGATVRNLLALSSEIRAMRHAHRAPVPEPADLGNRFRLMRVDAETLDRLTGTARAWGITLHDLLLATLMKSLSGLAPGRHSETRRRNIALGTIVNVRRDHGINSAETFGLFLGSFVVTHPVPREMALKPLAADLHRQTDHIKRRKLYLASPLKLRLSGCLIAMYSTPRQKKFYQKHHPLWGGITNMNINTLWSRDDEATVDYFRAVSTGPVTPLVLSVTTFGDHMNIGLTYRPAVFSFEEIDLVQEQLCRQFAGLEESP